MNYPLISEYVEAVKSAEDNLNELAYLRPVLDGDGNPVMSSGNFAVVFKMRSERDGSLYALKCFTKEQTGRDESYKLIADELECVQSTYLAKVRYIDKELFVDTQNSDETEFPILLMDWVEGVTLDNYIRWNINYRYALDLLAYNFSRLAMWLLPQPFAHGDLKPDNILVRDDGSLTLVDYDGMYVPAMQGQKARELGSPDFRHPLRTGDDFNEHIDDFPAVSILLSLKLIAQNPDLLNIYGASDRLLFSESDYRDLSSCAFLKEVFPSQSPDINTLVSLFTIANTHKNLSQVSFRLLAVEKPRKPKVIEEEVLSTKVTKEDLAEAVTDEFGAKYSKDGKRLLKGCDDIEQYKIKEGTKIICDYAFDFCTSLREISIPNSVTRIGDNAFSWCRSLQEIYIPNSVTSIGGNPFARCNCIIKSLSKHFIVENNVLYNADKTTLIAFISNQATFIIPNSVTSIGDSAFCWRSSLLEISIPNSVNSIGDSAFNRCSSLQEISIPNSVTSIGDRAFEWCYSLREIFIPGSVTSIGKGAFSGCRSLREIAIPNSVTRIGDCVFSSCRSLQEISIPNSITSIGISAFEWCDSLREIAIPNSVTSIGNDAFNCCGSLQEIAIPNSVTNIGFRAFVGCRSLREIAIPNSVTSIGDGAFGGCSSLRDISIPNSITSIGDDAFWGCSSLRDIAIPNSVTSIGNGAFYLCESLQVIALPDSITSIGNSSFHCCSSLKIIIIPQGGRAKFEKLLPDYKYKLVER